VCCVLCAVPYFLCLVCCVLPKLVPLCEGVCLVFICVVWVVGCWLQRVAVFSSVWQCVAVCCVSVQISDTKPKCLFACMCLQVWLVGSDDETVTLRLIVIRLSCGVLRCVAVCCSVLQCVVVCFNVL